MIMNHSVPPAAPAETVGILVTKLQEAFAVGDREATDRRFRRLGTALRSYDRLFRSVGLRGPDALDEAHQQTLIKVHGFFAAGGRVKDNPEGWARAVARNSARDLARQGRRQRARDAELDPTLAPSPPPPDEPELDFDALRDRMFRLFLFAAFTTGGSRTRREQRMRALMAWYMLRIARVRAARVAQHLSASQLSGGGVNAVYKWAERGAAQVRQFADVDPESEWAALLRRAGEARH